MDFIRKLKVDLKKWFVNLRCTKVVDKRPFLNLSVSLSAIEGFFNVLAYCSVMDPQLLIGSGLDTSHLLANQ